MRADGSEQTQRTSFGDVGYVAWSPRGGGLAFGRPNQIRVMDRAGRGQRLVARTQYTEQLYEDTYRLLALRPRALPSIRLVPSFTWLPDGRRLAFASPHQVCLVDITSREVTTLTHLRTGWCDEVCCSPDGSRVAFVHVDTVPPAWEALSIAHLPSGETSGVRDGLWPAIGERRIVSLSFSPDGHWLAYSNVPHTVFDGSLTIRAWRPGVARPRGAPSVPCFPEQWALPHDPTTTGSCERGYYFPVWAPSGDRLAARYDDWEQGYTSGVAVWDVATRKWSYWPGVGADYATDLSFSPDGGQLAFTHWPGAPGDRETPEIHVVDLRTGRRQKIADNAEMPCSRPNQEVVKP